MNNESKEWWEEELDAVLDLGYSLIGMKPDLNSVNAFKVVIKDFVGRSERRTWQEAKKMVEAQLFDEWQRVTPSEHVQGNNDACTILLSKIDAKLK